MPLFCIVVVVVVVFFLALIYILSKIAAFLSGVPVDGLWIDMNEPSNFCNGACNRSFTEPVSSDFNPHTPPYAIGNRKQPGGGGGGLPLNDKTLDMDAVHHNGATAYDMHNLYGEAIILPVMIHTFYEVEIFFTKTTTILKYKTAMISINTTAFSEQLMNWKFLYSHVKKIILIATNVAKSIQADMSFLHCSNIYLQIFFCS